MQPIRHSSEPAPALEVREGFSRFFRHERPRLWSYLRRVMGAEDAEDAAQEAFARVFSQQDKVRSPSGLLYSAARSLAVDARRRAARAPIARLDEDMLKAVADPAPSPEEHAHWRRELERAEAMLASMTTKCRTVFLLRVVEEHSYAEIAEKLGMSVLAVEKQLLRAFEICARSNGAFGARGRRGAKRA